jgi:hypothetical protein
MCIHDCLTLCSCADLLHTRFSTSGLCTGSETLGQRTRALGNSARSQADHTIHLYECLSMLEKGRCVDFLYLK